MNDQRELEDLRRRLAAVGVRGLPHEILERDRADEIRKMVEVVGPLLGHYKSEDAFVEVFTGWFQDLKLPGAADSAMAALVDYELPESRRECIAERLRLCSIEARHFGPIRRLVRAPQTGSRLKFHLMPVLACFAQTEHREGAIDLVFATIRTEPWSLLDAGAEALLKLGAFERRQELREMLASPEVHPQVQRSVERRLESMERKAAKAKAKTTATSRPKASKAGATAPRPKPPAAKPRATKKPAARKTTTPKNRSPR